MHPFVSLRRTFLRSEAGIERERGAGDSVKAGFFAGRSILGAGESGAAGFFTSGRGVPGAGDGLSFLSARSASFSIRTSIRPSKF